MLVLDLREGYIKISKTYYISINTQYHVATYARLTVPVTQGWYNLVGQFDDSKLENPSGTISVNDQTEHFEPSGTISVND